MLCVCVWGGDVRISHSHFDHGDLYTMTHRVPQGTYTNTLTTLEAEYNKEPLYSLKKNPQPFCDPLFKLLMENKCSLLLQHIMSLPACRMWLTKMEHDNERQKEFVSFSDVPRITGVCC